MSEEMNEYYVMTDEFGNEVEFQPVCTVEDEGAEYVVLIPRELDLGPEAGVVIMRIEDDMLVAIEDDEEAERIYDIAMAEAEKQFWDDDEDEEETP
ncbi:MAG: DUF1292 domain-containing protein [Butyricicoccaceae bacterium]